jgi:hypothetical protein
MSAKDASGVAGNAESYRPLPPHPDIEFEKKRAKQLLRDAKRGDEVALREMARVAGDTAPTEFKLALAQLAVARGYGFSSWVKLTAYYARWESVERGRRRQTPSLKHCESVAKWIRNGQAQGIPFYGQVIATHLPRLYARPNSEIFASPITDDEARFIAARQNGFASWFELEAHADTRDWNGLSLEERRARGDDERREREQSPEGRAHAAIRAGDLRALALLLAEHPDLIRDANDAYLGRATLIRAAVHADHAKPSSVAREIIDWLAARGADPQTVADERLTHILRSTDDIEDWIRYGANPNRVWPNGYSTLEHALIWFNLNCREPNPVDTLLRFVKPIPQAFWVAAGIGDVAATTKYFDRQGRLTAAARRRRPDFAALGMPGTPFHPDADDETVIFEAAWIAVLNQRTEVLGALIDRGFPVDSAPFNSTLLHMAVGCGSFRVAELLLSRGADADAPQLWNRSPRWLAAEAAKDVQPQSEERNRIRDLLASAPVRTS